MDAINPLYLVNVLIGLTLAICIAFVAYGRDRNLSVWALAFTLYPLAFFLFGFRSSFHDWVSIVFGNAALLIMFALFSEGMCRLNDLKLSRLWIWGPTPFSILGMIYLINDFETRTFFGAALTVYHSVVVLIIVKMSMGLDEGRGRWLIYGAAVCSSVMFITRVILMMFGQGTHADFLEPGFPQTVLLTLGLMWLIMLSIGLLVKYKERAESAMLRLALHDPLTQLGNRRVLNDRLSAAFQFSRLNSLYGAFMVLDLDYFKELNDTHGHALGDQLLIEVAYRLRDTVNDTDTVVRLGGDEFVLLIEGLDSDGTQAQHKAQMVADRVREKLTQPYRLLSNDALTGDSGRINYSLSVSIGVDLFIGDGKGKETLFGNADKAMYQAKEAGRNCVAFYNEKRPQLVGIA